MDKPTIFFSHSSVDRDLILPIKDKIIDITAKTMEIFMSSDGQSIPLGRNWVSKIEEGLENAQIMFIFVTPNSIKSDWIFFEAGYAYSKGIEVIPVGMGINVGELNAPLNLLQGFNISSHDSLNNFISVINKKFSLSFREDFVERDFTKINQVLLGNDIEFDFVKVFKLGKFELPSQCQAHGESNSIIRYDVDKFYFDIKEYLDKRNIKYSCTHKVLLVNGIKISITGTEVEPKNGNINQSHRICFLSSTYNFKYSFELLINLFEVINIDEYVTLNLEFNEDYDCLYRAEQLSSIISSIDEFSYVSNDVSTFMYMGKINWWIYDNFGFMEMPKYNLGFSFKRNTANVNDIIDFMNSLYKIGVIYKK